MAQDLSTFYSAGYGKQAPQVGTGQAQVLPKMETPDLAKAQRSQQQMDFKKGQAKQKKKSDNDKYKSEALKGFDFYSHQGLNKAAKTYYDNEFVPAIEAVSPNDPNYRQKIDKIVKDTEAKFAGYGEADKTFMANYEEYKKNRDLYEENPILEDYEKGEGFEIDYNNPEAGDLTFKYSQLVKKPERINPEMRVSEISTTVVDDIMKNPDFVKNYDAVKGLGSAQEILQTAELTPEGRKRAIDALMNDPKLQREYALKYDELENSDVTKEEYIEQSITELAKPYFKKSKSDLRSKPKTKEDEQDEFPEAEPRVESEKSGLETVKYPLVDLKGVKTTAEIEFEDGTSVDTPVTTKQFRRNPESGEVEVVLNYKSDKEGGITTTLQEQTVSADDFLKKAKNTLAPKEYEYLKKEADKLKGLDLDKELNLEEAMKASDKFQFKEGETGVDASNRIFSEFEKRGIEIDSSDPDPDGYADFAFTKDGVEYSYDFGNEEDRKKFIEDLDKLSKSPKKKVDSAKKAQDLINKYRK